MTFILIHFTWSVCMLLVWIGVLKLDSYYQCKRFFNAQRWAGVFPFRLNAFQTTNRIMYPEWERILKLNFFFNSWSDAALEVAFKATIWYWSTGQTLMTLKTKMRMWGSSEKTLALLVWIQIRHFVSNVFFFFKYSKSRQQLYFLTNFKVGQCLENKVVSFKKFVSF